MAFGTTATHLMFFIAVVGISAGVIAVFSQYVDEAMGSMGDKQNFLQNQLRTDIAITNVDNRSGHLYIYVKNIGKNQQKTDCLTLFVDGGWVSLAANQIVAPQDESAVEVWDMEQTIKLKPSNAPLNDQSIHEAKVVTCNAITSTESF